MKNVGDLFVSVIIAAAGKGTRMNMDINKQYVELSGIPVLARTIRVFEECGLIDEIVVVVNSEDLIYCKNKIINKYGYSKVRVLVKGGSERQISVRNGLEEVSKNCNIVIIHDGARPFVKEESIKESIIAANEFSAVVVAVPVKDTIKISDSQGFIDETLERSRLWSIQTPQAFRYNLIMEAHERAAAENFFGTDDAVLLERMGIRTKIVMGSYDNIKITTKEDLIIGEAILSCS